MVYHKVLPAWHNVRGTVTYSQSQERHVERGETQKQKVWDRGIMGGSEQNSWVPQPVWVEAKGRDVEKSRGRGVVPNVWESSVLRPRQRPEQSNQKTKNP